MGDRDGAFKMNGSVAPEKLWMTAEEMGWPGSFRSFRMSDLEHPEDEYPAYVRADLYEQVKRDDAKQALQNEIVAHGNTIRGKAERLARAIRELIASYRERFTDEKVDYQRGILDTLDNIEMVLAGTHDDAALAEPAGEAEPGVWTQADAERENAAFTAWWKERGYPEHQHLYGLMHENAAHHAWQEAAKRTAARTPPASAIREALDAISRAQGHLENVKAHGNAEKNAVIVIEKALDLARAALAGSAE